LDVAVLGGVMFKRLENFLLNKIMGKMLARAAVTATAFICGPLVKIVETKTGIHIPLSDVEVNAALITGAHALFEMLKAWRQKATAVAAAPAPATPAAPGK
jgi:hypothetical protein